jgi:hypothetical protein
VSSSVTQTIENFITAAYAGTPSLKTYFIVLDDDAHDTHNPFPNPGALTYFNQIQSDLPQAVTVLDATNTTTMSEAQTVAANFSKIVTQLGTCLYDYGLPTGANLDQLQVSYTIPGQPVTIIPADPNCNEANQGTVSGWNVDSGRVRICGQACSNLQSGILAATAAALQANIPAPDIGVTATLVCAPATTQVSDAGPTAVEAGLSGLSCAETCAGCCVGTTCFTGTQNNACGTGGQTCAQCNCVDGVCEDSGEGDAESSGVSSSSSGGDSGSSGSSGSSDSGG